MARLTSKQHRETHASHREGWLRAAVLGSDMAFRPDVLHSASVVQPNDPLSGPYPQTDGAFNGIVCASSVAAREPRSRFTPDRSRDPRERPRQNRQAGTKLMGATLRARSPTVTPVGLSAKRDEQQCFEAPRKCIVRL